MKNPLPGMNPWLEDHWRSVHTTLLVLLGRELNRVLPPELFARVEERVVVTPPGEDTATSFVADVGVVETSVRVGEGAALAFEEDLVATEPEIVDFDERPHRWLKVQSRDEELITTVELASPRNKESAKLVQEWRDKHSEYLDLGANTVEIDLLRQGKWLLPDLWKLRAPLPTGFCYTQMCVTRQTRTNLREFYLTPLRQRLPTFRVPLRPGDKDVLIPLQRLLDQCYLDDRYARQIDYRKPPEYPLPAAEWEWVQSVLAAGRSS